MGVEITQEPAIKKGTHYLSIAAHEFISQEPDAVDCSFSPQYLTNHTLNKSFYAAIIIPHGSVVVGAIVYGTATDHTWSLIRMNHSGGGDLMATANLGTEDTSISEATIDNQNYSYVLLASSIDSGDIIYGARITYTL